MRANWYFPVSNPDDKMENIKVLAFDADDTLWHNEIFFREIEEKFCQLLGEFLPPHTVARELLKQEIANLDYYGYGIKSFMLSMIETAIQVTDRRVPIEAIETILSYGKEMMMKPVDVMEGVEEVLAPLRSSYRLVVATKGDLIDQERKLKKSGLAHYFHHIEIMSDKKEADFQKLIQRLDILPKEFLMIGNSLKSDILPVLMLGGHGIHIPYHVTWEHEMIEAKDGHPHFMKAKHIREIVGLLKH
jgi:putative hydrolase of the HAD superfamily